MPYGNAIELSGNGLSVDTKNILKKTGRNTGNLLFHYAATLLSKEKCIFIDSRTKPEIVEKLTSLSKVLIIPLANILNEEIQVSGALIRNIKCAQCPIMVLGLGAQAKQSANAEFFSIPKQSQDFLKIIADKAIMVSCRGEFTLNVCKKYLGSLPTSFQQFGCPSILISPNPCLGDKIEKNFQKIKKSLLKTNKIPRNIIYTVGNIIKFTQNPYEDDPLNKRVAFEDTMMEILVMQKRYKSKIVFQTEPFLFSLISKRNASEAKDTLKLISKYFPSINECTDDCSFSRLEIDRVADMFNVYTSANNWILNSNRADLSISSRLHGTIAPLMAEIPAVCYYHDSRTKELCQSLKLPSSDLSLIHEFSEEGILKSFCKAFEEYDPSQFNAHRQAYASTIADAFSKVDVTISDHLRSILSERL